jgi:hypothetical protein
VGHGDEIIRECLNRDGGQVDDSLLMSVRLRVLLGCTHRSLGELEVDATGTGFSCRRDGWSDRESCGSNTGPRRQAWSWYWYRDGAGVHGQPCAIKW